MYGGPPRGGSCGRPAAPQAGNLSQSTLQEVRLRAAEEGELDAQSLHSRPVVTLSQVTPERSDLVGRRGEMHSGPFHRPGAGGARHTTAESGRDRRAAVCGSAATMTAGALRPQGYALAPYYTGQARECWAAVRRPKAG